MKTPSSTDSKSDAPHRRSFDFASKKLLPEEDDAMSSLPTLESPLEQGLMTILLVLISNMLPTVIAESGGLNSKDPHAVRRLIDKADALLLTQVEELACIKTLTRRRYWLSLLQVMLADDAITSRPGRKPKA
jgi:hypothetical protein